MNSMKKKELKKNRDSIDSKLKASSMTQKLKSNRMKTIEKKTCSNPFDTQKNSTTFLSFSVNMIEKKSIAECKEKMARPIK